MEPIEFEKNIEINPIYLDSNIKKNIVKIIQDIKICNAKDGYITEICDIKNIESVGISRHTNFPIFKVVFTAFAINPQAGSEYICKILKFNEYGFTLEHPNAPLVVFVQLETGAVDVERQEFSYKGGEKVLKVGDMVWVVLKEYHYSCKKFASIGYLKEDNIPEPPSKIVNLSPCPPREIEQKSNELTIPQIVLSTDSEKVKVKTPPKKDKKHPKAEVKKSPSVYRVAQDEKRSLSDYTPNSGSLGKKSVKKYKF